jgi:kumamolisin
LLLMAAAPAIGAIHSPRPSKIAVPQGIGTAALKGLKSSGVFNPGSTPETVSFILKARNVGLLEASVTAGMPGGYLSVGQFANRYGQPQSNVKALEHYLAGFGISSTSLPDGLDVTATGTADQFNAALSVQQHSYVVPAVPASHGQPRRPAMRIHGTKQTPLLPRQIGSFVLSILGLTNYPTFDSLAVHTPAIAKSAKPADVQTGSLTPEDFASRYDLNPLYARGATGAGRTIGIVTLASLNPSRPRVLLEQRAGHQHQA